MTRRAVETASPSTPAGVRARFVLGLTGVFLGTVVLCLGLIAVLLGLVPGWSTTVVASGSMEPVLRRGDAVVYVHAELPDLEVGRVVVFDGPNGSTIHRVVQIDDDGSVTTQGDANASRDPAPVTDDMLDGYGFVVVPWIGMFTNWWAEGQYLHVALSLLGLLLTFHASSWAFDPALDPWAAPAGTTSRPRPRVREMGAPQAVAYLVAPGYTTAVLERVRR